jgi:hypothetical protein
MSSFNENVERHARDAARELALQSVKHASASHRRGVIGFSTGALLYFSRQTSLLCSHTTTATYPFADHQLEVNCFTSRKHCAQLSGNATKIQVIATLRAGLKDYKAPAMMHSSPLFFKTTGLERMKR